MSTQKQERPRRVKEDTTPKNNAPEVVYTQAKPFQRRRFILHLLTVLAVVLAVFMGISVFFKVETVMVVGAEKYSPDTIWEASGIDKGDSLLFFGEAGASSRILDALPYVQRVSFDIELPGTVTIFVEEVPVVYAIMAREGNWWLMSAEGKLLEQTDSAKANQCTRILGVQIVNPEVGQKALAFEAPREPGASQPVTVLASDRLNTALDILRHLEENEILGKIATVDVSKLQALELWYGSQFQVSLGDSSRLDYKLASMKEAVKQLENQPAGTLDVSYTVNPDNVIYTEFDQ